MTTKFAPATVPFITKRRSSARFDTIVWVILFVKFCEISLQRAHVTQKQRNTQRKAALIIPRNWFCRNQLVEQYEAKM